MGVEVIKVIGRVREGVTLFVKIMGSDGDWRPSGRSEGEGVPTR